MNIIINKNWIITKNINFSIKQINKHTINTQLKICVLRLEENITYLLVMELIIFAYNYEQEY